MKRHKHVLAIVLAALLVFCPATPCFAALSDAMELPSLKDAYADDFLIGNIFTPATMTREILDFMAIQYNAVTAENMMKPDAMQPSKGNFNFSAADASIKYFEGLGISVIGHTLAWHSQSPAFLNSNVTRAEAEQNLSDHVSTVAGHFAGKILAWDVLNEAMSDGPPLPFDWRESLRTSAPWYQAFNQDGGEGWEYIYMVFKLAREADPNAILYYNDYNLNNEKKAKAVYYMVKELNEMYLAEGNDRLLIEGIGMQGHYSTNVNVEEVRTSIELFRELGVEISITELDVGIPGVGAGGVSEEEEERQAIVYAQLFKLFKEHSDVIARVTFWGLTDLLSWRSDRFPLLFTRDYSPKEAFYAVLDPIGYLESHGITEPIETQSMTGTAAYGTPVIDGEIDEIWATAEKLPISKMLQAWETAKGTARVLWDEEYLYVLAEVNDSALDDSSFNDYEQDSVEIFVDQNNSKTESFEADDGQYRTSFKGKNSFGSSTSTQGFASATTYTDSSYIVEMQISLIHINPMTGIVLGFDAQINDAKNGARVGIAKWNEESDKSYVDTSGWGVITLTGESTGEKKNDSSEPETTEDPASESPAGGDSGSESQSGTGGGDGAGDNGGGTGGEDEGGGAAVVLIIGALLVAAVVAVVVFLQMKKKKA